LNEDRRTFGLPGARSLKSWLRTLPIQMALLIILPLIAALLLVAFGGALVHTDAMRGMVALRNERTVKAAAVWLASQWNPEMDPKEALTQVENLLNDPLDSSNGLILFLVSGDGRVLAHNNPSLDGADMSDHPSIDALSQGETGSQFQRQADTDEEVVIAYSPVGDSGWGLLMEESWSVIADPRLRYSQVAPLVLVPALLLAAGALVFGIRRIVQPLQKLDRQTARLGWGEFDAVREPVGGTGEIRALQATLARMAEQLRDAQAGMRSYATALTQGQEEERARLARELHDETVQTLIALEHRVHMLRRAISRNPEEAIYKAGDLAQMAADAVQEVRRVIRALRPLYLDDLGWLPALRALVDDLNGTDGTRATLRVIGKEQRLGSAAELALFRIAQEALLNVARHSGSSEVAVSVSFGPDAVVLSIHDDGRGFTPPARVEELASAGHFGLMGMQERAQLMGARLRIDSAPGKGTHLQVALPVQAV
jgi:signal transduction histidine kinase